MTIKELKDILNKVYDENEEVDFSCIQEDGHGYFMDYYAYANRGELKGSLNKEFKVNFGIVFKKQIK